MGSGGIGAFAGGFANSFLKAREGRRLRDLDLLREQQAADKEQRMKEQFDQQQQFRVDQQRQLEEYRAKTLELQQRQADLQKKAGDINVMEKLTKAFDPKVPKAARQLILKQTAKALDIKPDSAEYKDFAKMANGLDDEHLKVIQDGLNAALPDAKPGEIQAYTKAIIMGDITMDKVMENVGKASEEKRKAAIMSGVDTGAAADQAPAASHLLTPGPLATQGGNLPIPGMDQPGTTPDPNAPTGKQPDAKTLRGTAIALLKGGFTSEGQAMLQAARDVAADDSIQLKEVVTKDGKHLWVREKDALNMEAPSARPTKTVEEERATADVTGNTKIEQEAVIKPMIEDAKTARDLMPSLDAFDAANKNGEFISGAAGGFRKSIGQWGQLLGIDPKVLEPITGGSPITAEIMDSAAQQINLKMADQVSRVTNMSLGFIQQAGPGIYRTPEGNAMIVELMRRSAERAIKLDDARQTYMEANGGALRPAGKQSFYDQAQKILREPLVDQNFVDEFIKTGKKGQSLKVGQVLEDAIKVGEQSFPVLDYTSKDEGSIPLIKLEGGQVMPYVTSAEQKSKMKPGYFLVPNPKYPKDSSDPFVMFLKKGPPPKETK